MVSRIVYFFTTGIWQIRLQQLSYLKSFSLRALRIGILAVRGFVRNDGSKTATALTYYSLLNIVPLIAVAFAMAKGFGLKKVIEKRILEFAADSGWQTEFTNQILHFSNSLLEKAKGGVIAGVGVILLLWSVVSILEKIEDAFNTAWKVGAGRTMARKFADYISVMVLVPIFLAVSTSLTIVVTSQVKNILQEIPFLAGMGSFVTFCLSFLPYLSQWGLFTVLYLLMPNTRVPWRSAVLGAAVAGTACQLVQWAYIKFQIGVASYSAIYGSFAALPLFLGWMQISWMIVLFGAEVAYALGHYETYGFKPDYERMPASATKLLTVKVLHLLVKEFAAGNGAFTIDQISRRLEIPVLLSRLLLDRLISAGLVSEVRRAPHGETAYQPGRSIEDLTIVGALEALEKKGDIQLPPTLDSSGDRLAEQLREISRTVLTLPANVKLKDLD